MTPEPVPTLTVRSPADLIAAVPYLLGFHPADSLVVVAVRGTRVVFAARYDLPSAGEPRAVGAEHAQQAAAVVARQGVDAVTVLGFGPARRVTPAVPPLADALRSAGLVVLDELRVTDGRFYSYLCQEPACCPPEGTACHPGGGAVAAAAVFAGQVALPDRAALAGALDPVQGAARDAVRAATAAAQDRCRRLTGPAPDGSVARAALRRAVGAALRTAVRRYADGGCLSDDEVAWLGVLLTHPPARDRAWELVGPGPWPVELWRDVVVRVQPEQVAAPACLLAYAAWRTGQGALAVVALDRARGPGAGDPVLAGLDEVLRYGLPPSSMDVPTSAGLTPAGLTPAGLTPAGLTPASRASDGRRRNARAAEGSTSEDSTADGPVPDGPVLDGPAVDGPAVDGRVPGGWVPGLRRAARGARRHHVRR